MPKQSITNGQRRTFQDTLKPFKLVNKSWCKAQITARFDEQLYTAEMEDGVELAHCDIFLKLFYARNGDLPATSQLSLGCH